MRRRHHHALRFCLKPLATNKEQSRNVRSTGSGCRDAGELAARTTPWKHGDAASAAAESGGDGFPVLLQGRASSHVLETFRQLCCTFVTTVPTEPAEQLNMHF